MSIIETAPPVPVERSVELDETGRVLLKAAEYLQRVGWGRPGSVGGRCISNAIVDVSGNYFDLAHVRLLASMGFERPSQLFAWNDAPGRTKAEVIEALERAAWLD